MDVGDLDAFTPLAREFAHSLAHLSESQGSSYASYLARAYADENVLHDIEKFLEVITAEELNTFYDDELFHKGAQCCIDSRMEDGCWTVELLVFEQDNIDVKYRMPGLERCYGSSRLQALHHLRWRLFRPFLTPAPEE